MANVQVIPTKIYSNKFHEVHREDGPAIHYDDGPVAGRKIYFDKGNLSRRNGPAVITEKGSEMYFVDNQLHRDRGPAIMVAHENYVEYHLHGIRIPDENKEIVMLPPEEIDVNLIFSIQNAEIRKELVRKVGVEILLHKLGSKILDKDGEYELHLIKIGNEKDAVAKALKMLNPSCPEVWHVEFVGDDCESVQDALNFRNGFTKDQIDDINGSIYYQQGDVLIKEKNAKTFRSRPEKLT